MFALLKFWDWTQKRCNGSDWRSPMPKKCSGAKNALVQKCSGAKNALVQKIVWCTKYSDARNALVQDNFGKRMTRIITDQTLSWCSRKKEWYIKIVNWYVLIETRNAPQIREIQSFFLTDQEKEGSDTFSLCPWTVVDRKMNDVILFGGELHIGNKN